MKNSTFEKAYKNGDKNSKKFSKAAKYITEQYVGETPGHPLTTEARGVIAECMAIDYSVGAELVKNKYLLAGVAIGVTGLIIANEIKKVFRKRRAKES